MNRIQFSRMANAGQRAGHRYPVARSSHAQRRAPSACRPEGVRAMTVDSDLLVIGAGMAGLTAAANVVCNGGRVVVLESDTAIGGNGRYAGYIWTAPSQQVMTEWNPDGSPDLKKAVVDRFSAAVQWVRDMGVHVGNAQRQLAFGVGHQFDTNHYIDRCRMKILENGEILTGTSTEQLLSSGGQITGARITEPGGSTRTVTARGTLLATGGFQANPNLIAELVHPAAPTMPLRSSASCRGDGLRLGLSVGASTGSDKAGFYGHLIPSGIQFADPVDFVDLSLYYSEHGLLFNINNERFTDESLADHLTTMALLEQPQARGLLIADARVHRNSIVKPYVAGAPSVDKFELAYRRGGRCGVAGSLEELVEIPDDWGYDGAAIGAQIEAYNLAVSRGEPVSPARTLHATPLQEPPYYIIEAVPAITYPFHGLLIDDRARVLDSDGTPILGLFAAGCDAGGLYVRSYAGSIAPAIVFSLAAADEVMRAER